MTRTRTDLRALLTTSSSEAKTSGKKKLASIAELVYIVVKLTKYKGESKFYEENSYSSDDGTAFCNAYCLV